MDLNNLILIFILIGVNILFYKYFSVILNKYNPNLLIDDQFKKPQAFHISSTSVIGGTGMFFSLLIIYFYFLLFKNTFFFDKNFRMPNNLNLSPPKIGKGYLVEINKILLIYNYCALNFIIYLYNKSIWI